MELSEVDDGSRTYYLRRPTDPNSNQPIRIFYPRNGKSRLARLLLVPWQPLQDVHLLLPGQTAAMLVANSDLTVAALPAAY